MRLALECPTKLLTYVQPLADFDWILNHKLEDKEYLEYYKKLSRPKFLDNSVNEAGTPCSIEDLKKSDTLLGGAQMIVSPDWIGDSNKTVEAYKACITEFGYDRVTPVVQGTSIPEALDCAGFYIQDFIANKRALILSIPYDIGSSKEDPPELMGLRRSLLINMLPKEAGLHLLGFTGIEELFYYRDRPNVLSIDTGVPVMLGLEGKSIMDGIEDKKAPTLNKMEEGELELTEKLWRAICMNVALLRKYL